MFSYIVMDFGRCRSNASDCHFSLFLSFLFRSWMGVVCQHWVRSFEFLESVQVGRYVMDYEIHEVDEHCAI